MPQAIPRLRVSVALCTHNGESFIGEQLLSILAQSFPPQEIVISDDASTDRTLEVARETVASYLDEHDGSVEFRVLSNSTPLGVSKNFEQAMLATRGDLIALSDQDDVWRSDRLERIVPLFEERAELVLVHSDARLIDGEGGVLGATLFDALEVGEREQGLIHDGHAFELLMRRNLVTGATAVMRRELAEIAAPFPLSWVHDEWLAIVGASIGQIDVVADALVDYRQHTSNQIGARKLTFVAKFGRLLEPGAERNARLFARAATLVDRLRVLTPTVPDWKVRAAEQKLLHENVRRSFGSLRIGRVYSILRELRTGRYSDFGRGLPDAVRDLLQPIKPVG